MSCDRVCVKTDSACLDVMCVFEATSDMPCDIASQDDPPSPNFETARPNCPSSNFRIYYCVCMHAALRGRLGWRCQTVVANVSLMVGEPLTLTTPSAGELFR